MLLSQDNRSEEENLLDVWILPREFAQFLCIIKSLYYQKWRLQSVDGMICLRFIIIMTNYINLSLDDWEKYANDVCLSIDQNIKQTAEQFFYGFVQSPQMPLIIDLIQRGSNLLVFALFSYMGKYPQPFVHQCQPFFTIMQIISRWQLQEFNFIRPGHKQFLPFVTRTIMLTLGTFMKWLYEKEGTSKELVGELEKMPLNYLKIYILKTFIETVEIVDTQMGYMRFRSMVYSFQDNIIPMICDALIPFFQNFQDSIRVSDLTVNIESKLDVSQQPTNMSKSSQVLMISREQEMESEYVLALLKKIVEFNYNITYTEYQSEQVIDTCLITFPERVAQKIINSDFLSSLFYVISKVVQSKIGDRKNQYLTIVLECVAKLMQARLGYVTDQSKQRFLCSAVKGLSHLLQICQQMQNAILLEGILVCNKKLFMSVDLSYIQRVIQRDPALKSENLYNKYVRELSWMVIQIVKESHINTQNTLLNQALEVVSKMVSNLGYKEFQSIEGNYQFYVNLLKQLMLHYVNSLRQPRYLFTTTRVVWLSDNKTAINNLFEMIKKLSSYVYEDFFRAIDRAFQEYMTHRNDLVVFSNLLFLISELTDRHYLERSTNMNRAKNNQIAILANTVKKVSQLVQEYANNRQKYLHLKDSQYLDVAVLIFCQSVLVQFLNSFESTSCIRIKQKLYMFMVIGQNYNEDIDYDDKQSEPTLIQYLNIVFAYLNTTNLSTDGDVKMLYALQIVQRVVFKLKWNMRRETFLKSDIFKRLLSFFDDYFMRAYPLPEIMAKVGKIIVSLNFDDILDEYKFRINKFIAKLPSQDSFAPVFYYMMGIFEGLEQGNIMKYFWARLKRHLNLANFFSQMFKMALQANSDREYKDICKFCKVLALNKGLRTTSNAPITYQIFNLILPHLVWFMNSINSSQNLNVDLLGDAILQLQEMFVGVLNNAHVNIFMLDQASKNRDGGPLGQLYVGQFMKMLIVLSKQLKLYPKLQESVLSNFLSINKQILQFIYDSPSSKLASIYTLLVHGMVELAIEYVTGQLNGNKLIEDKLIKVVDGLRLYHQYVNKKQAFLHKIKLQKNMLEAITNHAKETGTTLQNIHQMLIYLLISLIMTNQKNSINYLRTLIKLIFHLNKKYTKDIVESFLKVGVTGHKIKEISHVLESLREDMEQNFVQQFKKWVQEYDLFK